MDSSRYQPPKSRLDKSPRDREPGSVFKAVLLGATINIGGSILVAIVLTVIYTVILLAQGLSQEEIQRTIEGIKPLSAVGLIGSAFGLTMSLLGGYICARTVNAHSYTAVGIVSAISVAYGAVAGADSYEWPTLLMLNLLDLLAIFFGGWLYIRTLPKQL